MIFEVLPEHIEALSDKYLRSLVGLLAEREAVMAGYSTSFVTYGGHQNAADGGIDVRVAIQQGTITGFIARPDTGFQVKAEDFSPADIKNEMMPKGKLRPSIADLAKKDGAYIIVSSKGSVSDTSLTKRRNAMAATFANHEELAGLQVDFYDKRRIATWVNQHPGLVPWVRQKVGLPLTGWKPFEDWSSSPAALTEQYILDDGLRLYGTHSNKEGQSAENGIATLRHILAKHRGAVRIVGLSGVGKTRFVQALFDERIGENPLDKNAVVYADFSDLPSPAPQELVKHLSMLKQRCVLIVDNCGIELHRKLVATMKTSESAVSLITIEYDITEDKPEGTDTFKLEPSSPVIIKNILTKKYLFLSAPEIETIAQFSEGNARIAIALAETAKHGNSLVNLDDSELIRRLFQQNHGVDNELLTAARICSLVYSFDIGELEGADAEIHLLADLAGLTEEKLHTHIAELERRQLIQRRSHWRALLPHALAHKLAKQALQDISYKTLNEKFISKAPERLLKSFSRRLGYLHDSPEAQKIFAEWVSPSGRLGDIANLSRFELVLLQNMTPLDPDAVLKAILKIENEAFFGEDNKKRFNFLQLLRSFAYDEKYFDDAIVCILKFVKEVRGMNNSEAINVFCSLFHLCLSGTHASIEKRCEVILRLAKTDPLKNREIIKVGVDALLQTHHFSSNFSFDFGAHRRDYGYHPSTIDEIKHWYITVFNLVFVLSKILALSNDIKGVLAIRFRGLITAGIDEELLEISRRLIDEDGWVEAYGPVKTAIRQLKKDGKLAQVDKFEGLEKELRPSSLEDRLRIYVLPERWSSLDFIDIESDDPKSWEKRERLVEKICRELGIELSLSDDIANKHLPLILNANSGRIASLGEGVGLAGSHPMAFWKIIKEYVSKDVNQNSFEVFIGFFLFSARQNNEPEVESILDELLTDLVWHKHFVRIQGLSRINERGYERLITAASMETIPVDTFWHLQFGRACEEMPSHAFAQLIDVILERENGFRPALEIFRMRVYSNKSSERSNDIERATGRKLLGLIDFNTRKEVKAYEMNELVRFSVAEPEDEIFARTFCENLADAISEYKISPSDCGELLSEIAERFPLAVLDVFVDRDIDAGEGRRNLFGNFRESYGCPLRGISPDVMMEWVWNAPWDRFQKLSQVLKPWQVIDSPTNPSAYADDCSSYDPATLTWTETALRLLHEAEEPLEVLEQYIERFRPSGWSGSLSAILESRLPLLEQLFDDAHSGIAERSREAHEKLLADIVLTKKSEQEREQRRDESFEW